MTIEGTDAGEWISGSDANDVIDARGGDDAIYAPLGDNVIFGGEGTDKWIVYEGSSPQYQITRYESGTVEVVGPGLNGTINTNLLVDVELLLFNDGAVLVSSLPVTPGNGPDLPGDPVDPPANQPGVISLSQSLLTVNENDGTADILVQRTGGTDGQVTVDYQTFAISASAVTDFTPAIGTIVFADGQSEAVIQVPLLNDSVPEEDETFSLTIDNVTGGATLLAPRTAVVTIQDDDSIPAPGQILDFEQFTPGNVTALNLNGTAVLHNSAIRLTDQLTNQTGSVFLDQPLAVNADTSFSTQFTFQISGSTSGADGLAFVIQNSAGGSDALGGGGGGVGYSGLTKSLAIEFDTYDNGTYDPGNNHLDILANGDSAAELASVQSPFDLNGGTPLTAWIDYDGLTNQLSVRLASDGVRPDAALLTTAVSLNQLVGNQAFLGFTAATGSSVNTHEVLNWSVTSDSDLLPAPVLPPELTREIVLDGLVQPTSLDWSPDGKNLYVAEQRGVVIVQRDGQQSTFLDLTSEVNGTRDRGLLDIAVHPDFENNPYLYLLYTYDPPEVYNYPNDPLAGPDQNGNRAGRLVRVTADAATNYTTAVAGSEVVLLGENSTWENFNAFANSTIDFTEPPAGILPDGTNVQDFIASDSESHTVGAIKFAADGSLLVAIGDGASYNRVDPRAVRVQDIDNLSGKVLRIDPLTGDGLPDNPFFNGDADANRSKVYQYGFRNPFRIAVDPVSGNLYVGDVGWFTWEEVNSGPAGTNFGWPYYEGDSAQSLYAALPEAVEFYASGQPVASPLIAINHNTGINAIVLGDVYRGTTYPNSYVGDLFYNDLAQGVVRNVSFDANGEIASVETFATDADIVVMIQQGPDGNLYYVDLDDGQIGRWLFV
ncbi:MAG: PQQ-dependent sugar dehydrogenase [Planctomycetaceae bacterium]